MLKLNRKLFFRASHFKFALLGIFESQILVFPTVLWLKVTKPEVFNSVMRFKLHMGQASLAYNCSAMFHGKCGGAFNLSGLKIVFLPSCKLEISLTRAFRNVYELVMPVLQVLLALQWSSRFSWLWSYPRWRTHIRCTDGRLGVCHLFFHFLVFLSMVRMQSLPV